MMKENKLKAWFSWFIVGTALVLPVFFLPFFINPLVNSKLIFGFLLAFVCSLTFVFQSIKEKKWQIIKTPFTLPLLVFTGLVIISSFISHQYPSKQFLGMGGAYLSFALLVILSPSLINKKVTQYFSLVLNISALLLSAISILQLLGVGLGPIINQFSALEMPNTLAFALSGATFVSIQFLSIILFANLLDQKKLKDSLFVKITTLFIAVALATNVWAALPGHEAEFKTLSFVHSVGVAKESLTFTRNALFGYGPDSYSNAFNILKPLSVNGADYWQFNFDSAFNVLLTIIVSTGSIAAVIYLLFVVRTAIAVKNEQAQELVFFKVFILTSLIWQFFAPTNFVMLFLLAIALAIFTYNKQEQYKKLNFNTQQVTNLLQPRKAQGKNIVFIVGNTAIILATILSIYVVGKHFMAYHFLYKASASINNNEIAKAYDYHKQAKNFSPQIDFIRRSYSSLNLQIAIALSNKADIKTAEQEQVLQLVNQAISEAKAATVLEPDNYQNWLTLAQIYMQLIDTTDQAKQEAFNNLAKAATYNPSNPEIRLLLGQLFFNAKQYADAETFFNQAIEKKPNYFLAYYYLAKAQIANNELSDARDSLATGLNLLEKNSNEYQLVETELEDLVKQIQTEQNKTNNAADLETPTASDSAVAPDSLTSDDSNLSELLDQKDTEAVIQDTALSSDQNLLDNQD